MVEMNANGSLLNSGKNIVFALQTQSAYNYCKDLFLERKQHLGVVGAIGPDSICLNPHAVKHVTTV